ncbi:putative lipid II flippase FtsW [Stackebrandtia nassauensis]|uniref:Probable peptidoglycan glycosyltransferase FtsW n=1 Tax=Stackebrandtia nassauensis (strain DSM 44728 / CIP 108903 / NRRL B-16338 / NBRC 102104 / LLR-40K-21) TaxID=446470 RepID=D3PZX7_STANL|nr:putative lipid II flippase FtsW [Stackebrandtia nassauensis]ADD43664.1 cell cycle protein [Stackebrandtia nassauensis DSM 44728]
MTASTQRRRVPFADLPILSALRGLLDRPLASYYLLLASAGMLLLIGLVMVFSATMVKAYEEEGNAFAAIVRQSLWAVVGLVAFWIAQRLPVRTYRKLGKPLIIIACLLLGVLLLFPAAGSGALRTDGLWIGVGQIQFQPAEIMKFAFLLYAAGVLVKTGAKIGLWRELAVPLFPVAALVFLLVGYNDLGSMLCLVAMFFGLLWTAGVRLRVFAAMLGVAAVGALTLTMVASYRMERIVSFGSPENYADDWGYQAIQGYFAIGDGGWFGVGLGESRQKWEWLPNGHNDFIFALIAEELGVVGCTVVLVLFMVLAYSGFRIAGRVADPFRRLVAAGLSVWISVQAIINIGGVVGLMPITGLPLPLISDGGTALVVVLAAIGMLASFARAEPDAARALRARGSKRLASLLWAPMPPRPRERPATTRSDRN